MNPMRRKPQQARGQRRVNTILDAASQVFSELGYEAATTNIIAIRANTSIGSLYQFFPNKEAILSAIATRYTAQSAVCWTRYLKVTPSRCQCRSLH